MSPVHLTGHASIKSRNSSPLASTLLTSLVENFANHWLTILIFEFEDVRSNLDEERVKDTLVPLGEDVRNLVLRKTETALQNIISLSDKLHVAIFDTCENK